MYTTNEWRGLFYYMIDDVALTSRYRYSNDIPPRSVWATERPSLRLVIRLSDLWSFAWFHFNLVYLYINFTKGNKRARPREGRERREDDYSKW